MWRMRIARCIPKAINTHSEYVMLIAFYGKNSFSDVPQCYVIRTFHVVFLLESVQNESVAGVGGGVKRPGRELDH